MCFVQSTLSYSSKIKLVLLVVVLLPIDIDLEDDIVDGGSLEDRIKSGGGGIGAGEDDIGELGVHRDKRVGIYDETQNLAISMVVDLVFVFGRLKGDQRVGIENGTHGTQGTWNSLISMLVNLVFVFQQVEGR